jgi:preprotein translocase subunit SecY
MIDAFSLPDLRRRILITLGILVAFRFLAHVPLPGVDQQALADLFQQNALLGMLDLFSGGALNNFSIVALGVFPYITATIVMQLMTPVIPKLQEIAQEGESGRHRMNLIGHWLTVPLAALAGYGQIAVLQAYDVMGDLSGLSIASIIVTLTAGTMFLVWLGEQITQYGIGNGVSIIIFAGIVSNLPTMIGQGFIESDNLGGLVVYLLIALALTVLIVIFTEAHRRIPVQYAKTVIRSGRMYRQAGSSHIPLRVNTAGMIPLIFGMALVTFPGVIASYFASPAGQDPNFANTIADIFSPDAGLPLGLVYWGLNFLFVVGFTFFYTYTIFEQQDLPGTLQRQGGFIPGIRPGKQTKSYLNAIIGRITWAGALFLAFVAVMPFFSKEITNVQNIQLSSFGMIIVVGVVLDTMKQLEAQLTMRRYEGFIK